MAARQLPPVLRDPVVNVIADQGRYGGIMARALGMKALGILSWAARRLICESGVWGTVLMIPATRGNSFGSVS